ncbi:probable diphthine methyl ester synthase [Humulus lupulus]|uniref:probable diphthine methyl ester synthase n=1 Tax=Humulus lupulus TaxID=3486 RepID=UPI002B41668E|nr:probable diphthine methyl ester synthase [Humulus lupulus]
MTIKTAIEQLLEVVQAKVESVCNEDTECVGFARIGSEDQIIVAGTMKQVQLHVFFLSNSTVGVCNYSNFDMLLCKKLNSSIFCAESSNFSIC